MSRLLASFRFGAPSLALLVLAGCAASSAAGGATRTYYIAADEVTWDYVPGGRDRSRIALSLTRRFS